MDINITVANNLRALREDRRLSLEQAARLTGVSKSMLGQIERNEVTPTITVLWKIANGFKTSFTSLLDTRTQSASVIKSAEITPLSEDGGRFVNYPVFPFTEGCPFEIYRIIIKPSGMMDSEAHLPGTEEFITVFSGCLAVKADGSEYRLSEGDSIRFKSDVPHSYANIGTGETVLSLLIYYS